MEKRLLFNGIDMHGAGIAIDQGIIFSPAILPDAAVPPPPLLHFATPGTELTLHGLIRPRPIKQSRAGPDKSLSQFLGEAGPDPARKREESESAEAALDKGATAKGPET
jgi:hypothetical protein